MLFTLQRYEFFSKSQQKLVTDAISSGCCLPYKGTNFSANHNALSAVCFLCLDVVYPTKVRIFQQITTFFLLYYTCLLMLFTLQRYEFFSKSQRTMRRPTHRAGCCLPYKGTNFSANHNWFPTTWIQYRMLFTLQIYIKFPNYKSVWIKKHNDFPRIVRN